MSGAGRRDPASGGSDPALSDTAVAPSAPPEGRASFTIPQPGASERRAAWEEHAAGSLTGQVLQHFQVGEKLGSGGMGSVYRALDLSLDRPVALKVISQDVAHDEVARERFLREARAQARLAHPNVVPIYYIGEQDGVWFFAMEIEGESLGDQLGRGERLDWRAALEAMLQVADALRLAHRRGIVHRDIKPSNLLVDEAGVVKVADFGLAKSTHEDVGITQKGQLIGTPLYMSPEQGKGESTDHRSDIYSLGATFYHLLAGQPPFTSDTPLGIAVKHVTERLPALRDVAPAVPEALAGVLERMMEKDPARRYQDWEQVLAALRAARPTLLPPAGFWVRAMALAVDEVILLVLLVFLGQLMWAIYPLYFIGCWWRFGQTPGKWLFRLHVHRADDAAAHPALRQCVVRFLLMHAGPLATALVLWAMQRLHFPATPLKSNYDSPEELMRDLRPLWPLLLIPLTTLASAVPFVMVAFRADRRGFHDRLAGTTVAYRLGRA